MKVTIELEVESLDQVQSLVGRNSVPYSCHNRLRLLKAVHDFAKSCVDNGHYPSLTESKNIVWEHLTATNSNV